MQRLQYQAASFQTGKRQSKIGRPTKKERRDLDDFFKDKYCLIYIIAEMLLIKSGFSLFSKSPIVVLENWSAYYPLVSASGNAAGMVFAVTFS